MRSLAVLCCFIATALGAQQPPAPGADSVRAESARTALPPPSPEQKRFLDGIKTASRGIAQLKEGLNRVARAQATGDSISQRRAGRFLAGLCGSARAFMKRGRPQLQVSAYSDSTRLIARRLVTQVDSLIAFAPSCETSAAATPLPVAADLGKRVKTYDTAWRDFRVAIGLWVKEDSTKGLRKP